ncbi:MAG: thioredoxin domain-containing protein [bacterium]
MAVPDKDKRPNRLIKEKSPYLLQHAYNPVEWYPWTEEAFEKAKIDDKPVFLSIGYSTCHWCHVMAHESFEDPEIARLMNEAFVCVKVDREERPDIDIVYMGVCQMMTGSGGWPLSIFMTPDKKPFFAGTYFPRETKYGRIGMKELIPRIQSLWANERYKVIHAADQATKALAATPVASPKGELPESVLGSAFQQLSGMFDEEQGGFGTRPKFPTPHNLLFLLRMGKNRKERKALAMVEKTLEGMMMGGIFDHVGFGFHRYSTDQVWLVPHFEKMLYDQAMLVMAYTEAYQAVKDEQYQKTAEKVLAYVLRDMTASEGGFFSAEDADSEGVEGKFYVWSEGELREILSQEEAETLIRIFNVEQAGNYLEESTREKTGKNILHLKKMLPEIASSLGMSPDRVMGIHDSAQKKLFEARERRVHPHKDDKILTDWNGLMIAAFAKAAQAFDNDGYREAASRAADFILREMRASGDRLYHRYREGERAITGYLEDYAFMIWGLIELYEAVFRPEYLKEALALNNVLFQHFWDNQNGGFYHTADDAEALPVRTKDVYDGAIPSGNSVMTYNLLRLARITGESEHYDRAVSIESAFSDRLRESPVSYAMMLVALDYKLHPVREVVIAGDPGQEDTKAMVKALRSEFIPNKIVLLHPSGRAASDIEGIAHFTTDLNPKDGKATAYVCKNFSCAFPTTDPEEMLKLLRD